MANKIKLTQNNFNRVNMLTLKNGRGKYLNKIIFFDDNGIIFVNDGILNGKAELKK